MNTRVRMPGVGTVRIALLALLWLGLLAWVRPLMLPDEGRYVGVAWGMLRSGDWLTPTLDGLPYFHKPPLFYWITATAMQVFGVWEWPARLASILGAWAGALAVFALLRRWWGERDARLALWVLLLQPTFYLGAQFANLDMLVAGAITVTIALLAQAALALERGLPYRGALLGAYVAAALAVLAKGLIGMVLPGLVVTAWLLSGGRWRTWLRLLSLPGLALFALVAAPWFIAMQQRFPEFLHYFFVVQHFQRFAETGFNNVQPFWFYPAVLLLITLPWLPWLTPLWARGQAVDPVRADLRRLMWLWMVLVTAFFSLPASKLVGYILPAIPPLAVLLADGMTLHRQRHGRIGYGGWISAGVSVAFCVLVIGLLAARTPHSSKALGLALRAERQPGEPVFLLGEYYFDLPVYARLEQPEVYVLDWDDPEIRRRDTWRKELADAGDFDPELARRLLLRPSQLAPALCRARVAWLVGPLGAPQAFPVLGQARQRAANGEAALWRLTPDAPAVRTALGCSGTPTADSAAR